MQQEAVGELSSKHSDPTKFGRPETGPLTVFIVKTLILLSFLVPTSVDAQVCHVTGTGASENQIFQEHAPKEAYCDTQVIDFLPI